MKKLSSSQLQQLGIAATAAFKVQAAHDLLDLPADVRSCTKSAQIEFWRQRECASITGICSFRELDQRHYIAVRDYFQKLAGIAKSGGDFSRPQNKPFDGTTRAALLRDMWQAAHEAALGAGYINAILKNRFHGLTTEQLEDWQVKQLHDTIVNRARAKRGVGHTENRNKKQRAERMTNAECGMPNGKPGRTYTLKPHTKPVPDDNEPF